ncbi:MAG: alpha/beta hydrolase [Ruminococcaceae bacterium]|nr:alpha/beta hydrolase [Oscillospiraceae bacterium]
MKYIEYGDANKDAIILLHGGGFSWWNYREIAETLSSDYHIILPILDGHAESNDDFSTIEDNAARIISFIDEHLGGSVLLIGGLSLGGQILLEILSQRKNICRYALVESALVIPSKFTYSMIKPAFGSCYGLIKHKWFAKLQFRSYRIKQELFEDYFRDTCGISKQNMISFLQANSLYSVKESLKESCSKVSIFVGEKENNAMQKSASIIHNALPGSSLQVLPKMYHGEFSMNHANDYANTVIQMIQN